MSTLLPVCMQNSFFTPWCDNSFKAAIHLAPTLFVQSMQTTNLFDAPVCGHVFTLQVATLSCHLLCSHCSAISVCRSFADMHLSSLGASSCWSCDRGFHRACSIYVRVYQRAVPWHVVVLCKNILHVISIACLSTSAPQPCHAMLFELSMQSLNKLGLNFAMLFKFCVQSLSNLGLSFAMLFEFCDIACCHFQEKVVEPSRGQLLINACLRASW